jgi:solute carrier family 20 (sodium-dependent phosphate transporter)
MPQVGVLSMITEFVGAVGLGSRVTGTIKNGILDISYFKKKPEVLVLTMACAEFGSAAWLMIATHFGFPVSTTQTVVGAIVGAGIAAQAKVKWAWSSGSVSQIAASWAIAPMIAAGFSAIIFGTVKYLVLERKDPFKWAMRLIPFYLATTGGILALFFVIENPGSVSLEEFGAGKACGIILGVWAGCLIIAYTFFLPYFHRRLVLKDTRVRSYHIPLGPLLWREDPPIYFPAKDGTFVKDYSGGTKALEQSPEQTPEILAQRSSDERTTGEEKTPQNHDMESAVPAGASVKYVPVKPEAREVYLEPTKHLSISHPKRIWALVNFGFWRGVMKDCISHKDAHVEKSHARAAVYDNKVEHLWTYAQVASAMMMSISHGSNDVANAVGPWVAAYGTYRSGIVESSAKTPVWILVIAGFLLGAGFWFYGYHIIRSLGNKITRISPTRGFSVELGAAITVLLASRLSLPVSTTQCLTGATMGVALMNYDLGAVNWRQLALIFCGWILTLPSAGLIAGLLMGMALNTPHF